MSIKIIHSQKHKNNLFFSDFFQRQNRNVILMTHYREERAYHENINSFILERLVQLDLQNVNWNNLTSVLQEFFLNLNWEVYAQFNKYDSSDAGLSILLAVIEDNSICFVSCGRFLCGVYDNNGFRELDKEWDNFHVKTKENLGTIGSIAQDLKVKPQIHKLPNPSLFLVIAAAEERASYLKTCKLYDVSSYIAEQYQKEEFPYSLLYYDEHYSTVKRPWYKAKRFRITGIIMLLMLLFSIYYIFMGREALDDRLHITREQFQLTLRNIDILKIQEIIPLDYGILLVPQRNIELMVDWESILPFKVTAKPYYCIRNIYLVSSNTLHAYDKRDKKSIWKLTLDSNINSLEILDANLMIAQTTENKNYCLKRDTGEIVWTSKPKQSHTVDSYHYPYQPVQISLEMDRRLSTGILLLPEPERLTLINILNGDTLSYYEADDTIYYISDFDLIEKSIYMIKGNKLYKVRFDIRT